MMKLLNGKAWIFGDNLDCDYDMYPTIQVRQMRAAQGLQGRPTEEEMGKYAMVVVDPDFPKKAKKGDIVVCGTNCGMGKDHIGGARALKGLGISVLVAESVHEWFWRNSLIHGFPLVMIPGIKKKVKEGDELEIDLVEGRLTNVTTGEKMKFEPLPKFLLNMLDDGGLLNYAMKRKGTGNFEAYLSDAIT
jgi:3-isopropylmalate/(R)-2-methylmalate dehydratase small subunit